MAHQLVRVLLVKVGAAAMVVGEGEATTIVAEIHGEHRQRNPGGD